jgi:multidrug efflux pump subunit AcrA (membrane-fusion protein)
MRRGSRFQPPELAERRSGLRGSCHKGLQLPEQAIVYKGKDAFVRLLTDKKAKYIPVKLGQMRNGKVEILEGLSEDQEVILRSNQYISDDEKVDVQKKESE